MLFGRQRHGRCRLRPPVCRLVRHITSARPLAYGLAIGTGCPIRGLRGRRRVSRYSGHARSGQASPYPGPARSEQASPYPGPARSGQASPYPGPARSERASPYPGPARSEQASPYRGLRGRSRLRLIRGLRGRGRLRLIRGLRGRSRLCMIRILRRSRSGRFPVLVHALRGCQAYSGYKRRDGRGDRQSIFHGKYPIFSVISSRLARM